MKKILDLKQLHALSILENSEEERGLDLSGPMIDGICSHLTELRELKFEIFELQSPLNPTWPKKLEKLKIVSHMDVESTISLPSNLKNFQLVGSCDAEGWSPSLQILDPIPLFTAHLQKIHIDDVWIQESAFLKIANCPNVKVNFSQFPTQTC